MFIKKRPAFLEELETERLFLRLLDDRQGSVVLDYYERNRESIELNEPAYEPEFYTVDYQNYLLRCAANLFYDREGFAFWIYLKEGCERPIGHISFLDLTRMVYQCCDLGYKLDKDYTGKGYATEAVLFGMDHMFKDFGMQRIECLILPENEPSIRLVKRCGFSYEGLCRSYMYLRGRWRDYERYSFLRPDSYPALHPVNN